MGKECIIFAVPGLRLSMVLSHTCNFMTPVVTVTGNESHNKYYRIEKTPLSLMHTSFSTDSLNVKQRSIGCLSTFLEK